MTRVFVLMVLFSAQAFSQQCFGQIKPLTLRPIGCSNGEMQCVCDESSNCRWQWVCERESSKRNRSGIDSTIPLRFDPGPQPYMEDFERRRLELEAMQQNTRAMKLRNLQMEADLRRQQQSVAREQMKSQQQDGNINAPGAASTKGFVNGRFWTKEDLAGRFFYLVAFREAMMIAIEDDAAYAEQVRLFLKSDKLDELASLTFALDDFYSDARNLNIRVWQAMLLCVQKLSGTPEDLLAEWALKLRREADADWLEQNNGRQ